jgi:hypothetical protein
VFKEIYKDSPFDAFLVPNSPQLSALNLAKLSYQLAPSSNAAITVAQISAGQYFGGTHQSASTTAMNVATAEDYLNKADLSAQREQNASPDVYKNGERYLTYRIWRAITIGFLAVEAGEPFKSQYRQEYEDFITYAKNLQSTHAKDEIFYARMNYARILASEKDLATEKVQLDAMANELGSITNVNSYSYSWFLRNQLKYRPTDPLSLALKQMYGVSPSFKAIADKLAASK